MHFKYFRSITVQNLFFITLLFINLLQFKINIFRSYNRLYYNHFHCFNK